MERYRVRMIVLDPKGAFTNKVIPGTNGEKTVFSLGSIKFVRGGIFSVRHYAESDMEGIEEQIQKNCATLLHSRIQKLK